jgi:hypothetical protein
MNNWNMTNISYQRWLINVRILKGSREMPFVPPTNLLDHISNQALIANMNYVCYLAQEWAGARK